MRLRERFGWWLLANLHWLWIAVVVAIAFALCWASWTPVSILAFH